MARHLYDLCGVLTPYFLSITAGSPVYRGFLTDSDTRWMTICQGVDDRPQSERFESLEQLKLSESQRKFLKSRYETFSTYLSSSDAAAPAGSQNEYSMSESLGALNDIPLTINERIAAKLREATDEQGLPLFDEPLIRHFAYLFARDPLVIFGLSPRVQLLWLAHFVLNR